MRSGFFASLVAIGAAVIVVWMVLFWQAASYPNPDASTAALGVVALFVLPPALLLVCVGIPYGVARLPPAGTRGRRRDIAVFIAGGVIAVLLIGSFVYTAP